MKVTLVDLNDSLTSAAKSLRWNDIELRPYTDIKAIVPEPGMAFVSPANSLGFMDGGIDLVYSRIMFPGIESRLKMAIKQNGLTSILGRPYLPIGQALVLPTQHEKVYFIAAPTMWLPQDVSMTHNAYHAMYAVLEAATKNKEIHHIILCGLCTGYGKTSPKVAIEHMYQAYQDHVNKSTSRFAPDEIIAEQPNIYMNTEFKEIYAHEVLDI